MLVHLRTHVIASIIDHCCYQAGGRIGKWIAEALLNTGKHTVTGITRADSPNKLPEGVIKAAYSDDSSLVESLKGQQLLIITMHARANPDAQAKLVDAAVKAGVSYVMPNGVSRLYTSEIPR